MNLIRDTLRKVAYKSEKRIFRIVKAAILDLCMKDNSKINKWCYKLVYHAKFISKSRNQGETGEVRSCFPIREKSGNFINLRKIREFVKFDKISGKNQGI